MVIYGAGISGLLAGCLFQTAKIFEAGQEGHVGHKAVLRFRSSVVGDATGIDFRRVKVRKGIWSNGKFVQPNIQLANAYAMKVIGRLVDRSIWNLETVDRFIAPPDFVEMLAERCRLRTEYNHTVTKSELLLENISSSSISTLPMNSVAEMLGSENKDQHTPEFAYQSISVKRWEIPNADVFQTVYFPDSECNLYRASITGNMLIAEYSGEADPVKSNVAMFSSIGLSRRDCNELETIKQKYGKIAPIDDAWRKKFMFDLSAQFGIYSLGRFGTWRNILLDDVIKDITVIKRLMNSANYDLAHHCTK